MLFILAQSSLFIGLYAATEEELPPCPAVFLMDALVDAKGSLWVVAEAGGVWRLSETKQWEQMSLKEGFPNTENCYAIAEDHAGRIWVGTDNQGGVVWNGETWQQYSQTQGLAGERVYDIAVNPVTGMVALATSGGLSLYMPQSEQWKTISREDGLEEDQVESLSFSPKGNLFIGYSCGGVALGSAQSQYTQWIQTKAKWFWDDKQYVRQPMSSTGEELPSNLCNVVLAPAENQFWVGTTSGIAKSTNTKQWFFLRGQEVFEKNKGLYQGNFSAKSKAPAIKSASTHSSKNLTLLPEDFVTAMLSCPEGIWIGFREQGACLIDPQSLKIKAQATKLNAQKNGRAKWVRAFITLPSGQVFAATNGGGLQAVGMSTPYQIKATIQTACQHPKVAALPSDQEMAQRLQRLSFPTERKQENFPAAFWYEDWGTQGDWCQRYGRRYGVLSAAMAPLGNVTFQFDFNFKVENGPYLYSVQGAMGPHRKEKDGLRHWVHWVNQKENRNVLYNPAVAIRTEAEWDDQGEIYSRNFDGPDVWALVDVPQGPQLISLYFYNPNGREALNGHRDYLLELRRWNTPLRGAEREAELAKVMAAPVLARARVNHFSGSGVYKTFMVQGPASYAIRVCRNYSMNTILNGVFLSTWNELEPLSKDFACYQGPSRYAEKYPDVPDIRYCDIDQFSTPSLQLWGKTRHITPQSKRQLAGMRRSLFMAYRKNQAHLKDDANPLLRHWRWQLRLWESGDHEDFDTMMLQDWYTKQEKYTHLRTRAWCDYSDHVIPFTDEEASLMATMKIEWKDFLPEGKYSSPQDIQAIKLKLKQKMKEQERTKNEQK